MFLKSRLTSKAPQVLVTVVVFSIASGVLGGALLYLDASSRNVLSEMTSEVEVDLEVSVTNSFYAQNSTTLPILFHDIIEQQDVSNLEMLSVAQGYSKPRDLPGASRRTILGVNNTFFQSFGASFSLSDDTILRNGECYVEEQLFIEEGLAFGETWKIPLVVYDSEFKPVFHYGNLTVIGTFSIAPSTEMAASQKFSSLQILTSRQSLEYQYGSLELGGLNGIRHVFWLQLDRNLLHQSDPASIVPGLKTVKKRIEQAALPYALVERFDLLESVYGYGSWSSTMTLVALAFSVPSVIMGIMLVNYNSEILADERRREIGNIVTRGAKGRQAFVWVMGSALVTGILGSFGAVGTGILAAVLSGTTSGPLQFDLSRTIAVEQALNPELILYVFSFSFVVGVAVSLPSALRALIMLPSEARMKIDRQTTRQGCERVSPVWEISIAAVSAILVIPMLGRLGQQGISSSGSVLFAMTLILLFSALIIGSAKALSRLGPFLRRKVLGRVGKTKLAIGPRVLSRNLRVFRTSEALGTMFIVLVFASGFFSAIASSTGAEHIRDLYTFEAGADIVIHIEPGSEYASCAFVDEVADIEGVHRAAGLLRTVAWLRYMTRAGTELLEVNTTYPVYAVQPERWSGAAFWLPYFVDTRDIEATLSLLSNSSNILSSFKPLFQTADQSGSGQPVYTDEISVSFLHNETLLENNCTIVGLLSDDETTESKTYLPGVADATDFIIMNIEYVYQTLNTSRITEVYVSVKEGSNPEAVVQSIREACSNETLSYDVPSQEYDALFRSATSGSIYGVYALNLIFSLGYLTAGMVLLTMIRGRKLRKQLAILRAMGTQRHSLSTSLLLDSAFSTLIGAALGLVLASFLTLTVMNMPLVYAGSGLLVEWSRLTVRFLVPPAVTALLLALSLAFALGSTYFISNRILNRNLAEELRTTE